MPQRSGNRPVEQAPASRAETPAQTATGTLAARIHAALPQTQCTRCGYPDCAAYAQAIATDQADINQCPPGGAEGVQRLADITGLPISPLNPTNGIESPRSVAVIDENWCIGCTLCLPVCPTDAILGSNKMMHIVIEPHCTGCELCLAVCPVDCISLENVTGTVTGWQAWSPKEAEKALNRYTFHSNLYPDSMDNSGIRTEKPVQDTVLAENRKSVIAAALAKARAARIKPGS